MFVVGDDYGFVVEEMVEFGDVVLYGDFIVG